ncbi:hypothetical protein P691DRAFT_837665 [Macrolepiota fuliginosa MF-IS2]|uniref:Wax synthase domain-containing protein n=1 Tax=Macrolepiota fuliginosa MF-IS2 TaxID=1400762 RepID=A0A9P6BXS4_9AGAR|nr:hypothetical protein P691DRAFT_837665 [Macrolepiota fuliginosa MF-IS2]
MDTIWDEVKTGTQLAFRTLIPPAEERIPLTWGNGIIPVLCYVPLIFMAYLARRPNTYPIRVLLVPSTVSGVIFAAYHFTWIQPIFNVFNWGQCLMAAVVIAKAFDYGLRKEGMLKIGESRPGVVKGKSKPSRNGNGDATYSSQNEYIPTWLSDAFELLHTNRGLAFKFGQGTYIPPFTRPLDSRRAFLLVTLRSFITNYLYLDFCESIIKVFPGGIATPLGGSMFYSSLPAPFPRYLVSTLIHILTGSALLSGFGMVYDLCILFAVGVIGTSPTSWPPVFENPWVAESLHELWARRWHQLLRQTFIIYGGYPGKWLFEILASTILGTLVRFGNLGMLLGTFVASGLFHECAMYSMNRGFDRTPVIFFAAQGPILIGERVWKKVTGRKVGGWLGRLWVYVVVFILAQPMVNSWHRRGLGGGMVLPPKLSPMCMIFLPLLRRFVPWL